MSKFTSLPYLDINFDRVLAVIHPDAGVLQMTVHYDNGDEIVYTWGNEPDYIDALEAIPV